MRPLHFLRGLWSIGLFSIITLAGAQESDSTYVAPKKSSFESWRYRLPFQIEGALQMHTGFSVPIKDQFNFDNSNPFFQLRRARIGLQAALWSPQFTFHSQLGFSQADRSNEFGADTSNSALLDAYIKYQVTPQLQISLGQRLVESSLSRNITYRNLHFIDRNEAVFYATTDRDRGLFVDFSDELNGIVYRLKGSVSIGEGRNFAGNNLGGLQYAARVEILPFGQFTADKSETMSDEVLQKKPKVLLGASYVLNDNAARSGGNYGSFIVGERDVETIVFDGLFHLKGFSFLGEFIIRNVMIPAVWENPNSLLGTYNSGYAYSAQAAYRYNKTFEPTLRFVSITPEKVTRMDERNILTAGVNAYFLKQQVKWQSEAGIITNITQKNQNVLLQSALMFLF